MSDNVTDVKIVLNAKNNASEIVNKLRSDVDRLAKSLRAVASINISGLTKAFANTEAAASRAISGRAAMEARFARQRVGGEQALDRARRAADAASAAALRERFAFVARMGRQQRQDSQRADRERRAAEAATMREFRQRLRFNTAMGRQQAREARQAEQARQRADATTDREAAQALRRRIAGDRWRFALRERMERQARQEGARVRRNLSATGHEVFDRGRDAAHEVASGARTITLFSAIGAGIVGKIASAGLKARSTIDSAEANARMFGGMSRDEVQAARDGWLDRAALDNAFRPADALNSWTEALKAGIAKSAAPDVTRSIMGASAGLDLNVAETTRLVGRLSTLTQNPLSFKPEAIDGMLNSIAVVAKTTAADSRELVSSLRRGAGVLGSSKMSVGDLTAFTGAGISAGIQEGKAGTFMDFLVNDLVNAKNQRGQRRVDLDKAFRLLGLGGAQGVSRQAAQDPTKLLMGIFGKMETMSPDKAGHVASLVGMREWRGELLQMMKALPSLRQAIDAVRDPKNANHLGQARDEKLGTLAGLRSQLRATGDLALEAIGAGLEDLVRDAGKYFLDLGRGLKLDVIRAHVHTLLDGLVDGLGFRNVRELLERVLGRPGEMDFSRLNSFFTFAQGFGRGLREVVDSVLGIGRLFVGQDASADTMGNFAAKLIGFSAAVTMAGPAVGILGAITSSVTSLATAAVAGWSALKLARLAAGSAAGAGSVVAVAGLRAAVGRLFGGLGLGIVASIGAHRGEIVTATLAGLRSIWEGVVASIKTDFAEWSRGGILNGFLRFLDPNFAPDPRTIDQGERGRLRDGIREDRDRGPMGALWKWLWRSSARNDDEIGGGSGAGGLRGDAGRDRIGAKLQPAFSPAEEIARSTGRMAAAFEAMGARVQVASIGSASRDALASFTGGIGGGGSLGAGGGPAGAFGSRFSTPRGMSVPGWFGRGSSGGGSAGSNPANSTASVAMLDAIAGTESGKAGYDAVLGNGKYGMPSKPVSQMSLDEAFAFGRQIRARHGSSSALGRYQIVGRTMRAAQQALGIPGDAIFDGPMQDRMARWIARNQGLGAWEGLKHNPAALARARAALAAGGAQDISPAAPTGAATGVPGLGGAGQYDGLKVKGAQATAAGGAHLGVTDLARQAQANLPGGVKHFAAFNDRFHAGTRSKHALGLAFDTSLIDPSQSAAAAEAMRAKLRAAGLDEKSFKVIDEYKNPSARSTGGHIHTQFNSKEAAEMYHKYIEAMNRAQATVAEGAAKSQEAVRGFSSTGWRPVAPATAGALSPEAREAARAFTSSGWRPSPPPAAGKLGTPSAAALAGKAQIPTADVLASKVPNRAPRVNGSDFGGRNGAGSLAPLTTVNIHAANMSPAEMGGHLQRHLSETQLYRAHDFEHELT